MSHLKKKNNIHIYARIFCIPDLHEKRLLRKETGDETDEHRSGDSVVAVEEGIILR